MGFSAGLDKPFENLTVAEKESYWAGEKVVLQDYASVGFTFIERGPSCPGNDLTPSSATATKTKAQLECLSRYLALCKTVGVATFLDPKWAGGKSTEAESDHALVGYVSRSYFAAVIASSTCATDRHAVGQCAPTLLYARSEHCR